MAQIYVKKYFEDWLCLHCCNFQHISKTTVTLIALNPIYLISQHQHGCSHTYVVSYNTNNIWEKAVNQGNVRLLTEEYAF
jgi:hypothetical protein